MSHRPKCDELPDTGDRLQELVTILARGVRRHLQNQTPSLGLGVFDWLSSVTGADIENAVNAFDNDEAKGVKII
jgi:hypothetical protein